MFVEFGTVGNVIRSVIDGFLLGILIDRFEKIRDVQKCFAAVFACRVKIQISAFGYAQSIDITIYITFAFAGQRGLRRLPRDLFANGFVFVFRVQFPKPFRIDIPLPGGFAVNDFAVVFVGESFIRTFVQFVERNKL